MIRIVALAALVGTLFVGSFVNPADAQTIRRQNTSGQSVYLPLPANRAQCLANRRKLGFDTRPNKDGAGICNRLFPKPR